MKKFLAIILTAGMVLSLAACGGSGSDSSSSGSSSASETDDMEGSVAMAIPGLITDEAFNQFTYEGMVQASEEKGFKIAYKENVAQDEQVEVIRQFAQQGYSIVIGDGGQFGEALATVAAEFPDTQFVFTVGTETYDMPNLTAATVSYSHAGFIGGVIAALTTTSNKCAFIAGELYETHKQMEASFQKGLEYVSAITGQEIEFTESLTGDWADVAKARETSLALIEQGYDVLFPCLDAAGAGVAAAAQDSTGVSVVGSVADYAADYGASDVTVASVTFAWDTLGYVAALGEICDGEAHVIGLADGGIEPVFTEELSADAQEIYDSAIDALLAGEIDIDD